MNILKNWNFMRVFRLLFGLLALGMGIYKREVPLSLLGFFFAFQAVFMPNACCGGTCYNPVDASEQKNNEPIEFTEIENKK